MLFFPKNEPKGTSYVLKIALITLLRMPPTIFSSELAVLSTRSTIRESRVFPKKDEFRCAEQLCLCSRRYCFYDKQARNRFSSNGVNERTLEECGDGEPISKYRKVLEKAVNVTATNRGSRTIQHSVAM